MVLSPRESGKLIFSLSKHIKINENGIARLGEKLVQEINSARLSVDNFSQHTFHPRPSDPWALEWMFVVDTLNFCFWTNTTTGWMVEGQSGYFALCAAINRALKDNIDILNPQYYSKITEEQLSSILRSDTEVQIPLLPERVKCLHQVGKRLIEIFNSQFTNCVKLSNHSVVSLLTLITENFECFRDEALFHNNHVSLYKRAQILIGDIWACFKNEGLGYFEDIEELTMFADYRVPQTLLYYDVFEYDEELINELRKDIVLENGSEKEVEIRGCSIYAVDLLCEYCKKRIHNDKVVNCILIDHFLWDFRRKYNRDIVNKKLPFHKTYSIYY